LNNGVPMPSGWGSCNGDSDNDLGLQGAKHHGVSNILVKKQPLYRFMTLLNLDKSLVDSLPLPKMSPIEILILHEALDLSSRVALCTNLHG
jgi:hypothetical protein